MFFLLLLISSLSFISCSNSDIPSLPYCPETELGLLIVSTLNGKISALNSSGSLVWEVNTGPGPLLLSNIHNLELTNSGEWIRIIPSLAGTLYKFDGNTIDPIPITTEELLKASFRYSDDLVIAGGIEVRTYGVGFRTGQFKYECNSIKCSNTEEGNDGDDVLVIERSTHTIRAVEPRTGSERWNFSVGLHNIKLSKISCINLNSELFDWNVSAILPEGKLRASVVHNNVEESWNYIFDSPIVKIWRWSGKNLSEIDLFAPRNVPQVVTTGTSLLPSIYLGMHNKQLYIHESSFMQHAIRRKTHTDLAVTESTSIAKIPWKPIPASTESSEEDSTALSVLNASEYVNGQGFYLYSETDLKENDKQLCDKNDSFIEGGTLPPAKNTKTESLYYLLVPWYWKELILMVFTLFIGYFLFRIRHNRLQEVIIIEKPVEVNSVSTERRVSERDSEIFTSRYINDFDTLRCLGKGGFGVVFEVKQKIDECHYAIKRITLPDEDKDRDRVMREVKALAKLEHQNIVRYFCSWVEKPPLGWQQEHDRKWLGDKLTFEQTFTSTSELKMKRGKSVSISIEELGPRTFDPEIPNIVQEADDDDADDSFIVFEHDSKSSSAVTSNEQSSQKAEASVYAAKEVSYAEHLRKKIDWKRPDRKHHSWDVSQTNLITLDTYSSPVFLYIQMQLCQKESLKEWLSTHHERDYNFVKDIFYQILEAVEYVHLRGLIHRDLKPSNIFFSLEGQVKVGDFGLVKDMEDAFDLELIKKGSSPSYRGHTIEVGTQLYMSPEQFHSRIYDYKVDIYSLGLIFFELLVPFHTEMERNKMLSDVKKNIYPSGFTEKFPDEHVILQNMLCKDPNKRLTTIGIKARPPFNREDSGYSEDCHYRLLNFQKS
ncbi:unnamed protein product [Psylliodes chrysocephalus]|uniref:non-specific serine/threonine protein kinase n=1 Tax=Psylliodes chrysocephalus TaxID=3402493 RepID=A0A9P0CR21_9CUCU|nr:unnamed protein product [Psylliodes chrysocephala]